MQLYSTYFLESENCGDVYELIIHVVFSENMLNVWIFYDKNVQMMQNIWLKVVPHVLIY